MSGSVHKVKEWIDKHAAVIDPHTQSLLRKELEDELKKVEKPRRKVKTSMKELPNGDLQLENGTTIPAEKRQKTEVYSRVVGYLRPVRQWNKGKQSEWKNRREFIAPKIESGEVNDGGSDA